MKQKIQEELKTALKQGEALKVGTFRMLLAAVANRETQKRYEASKQNSNFTEQELVEKAQLSEEEFQSVVVSEAKKRREAIEGFEKGNRTELAEKEKQELDILMGYLPQQLSEEEIREIVKEAVEKVHPAGPQDMGKLMGELMPKVKGKADGALVSKIVREML